MLERFDENARQSLPPHYADPLLQHVLPPPVDEENENEIDGERQVDQHEEEPRSISPPLIVVRQQRNHLPPHDDEENVPQIGPAYFEQFALVHRIEENGEQSIASTSGSSNNSDNDEEEVDLENVDQLLDLVLRDEDEELQREGQESNDSSSSDSEDLESQRSAADDESVDEESVNDDFEEDEREEITRIADSLFPRNMEIENNLEENEDFIQITHEELINMDNDDFLKIIATGRLNGQFYRRKFDFNDERNLERYTTKSDIDSIAVMMENLNALKNTAIVKVYPFPDKRFAIESSNGAKYRNRPVHHYRNFRIATVGPGSIYIHIVNDTKTNARGQTRNPGTIKTQTIQHIIDVMMEIISELNPTYVDMPVTFKSAGYKNRRHNGNFIYPEFAITGSFFKRTMVLLSERVKEVEYQLLRGGIFFHFSAKNLKGLINTDLLKDDGNPYDKHHDNLDEYMLLNIENHFVNWNWELVLYFTLMSSSLKKIPRMLI